MNLNERAREHPLLKHIQWYGIAGSILMLACVAVSMVAYSGTGAERYSPLNHFISELGQVGVSRLAAVFNAGLVASGVLYLPFTLGLGAALGGWWAAAMTFFRSDLLTVLLTGIAIQRQRPGRHAVDRRANVAGVVAVLAFAAFLLWMQLPAAGTSGFHEGMIVDRPAVWPSAILEWSILVAMAAWFFVVGACRLSPRAPRRPR